MKSSSWLALFSLCFVTTSLVGQALSPTVSNGIRESDLYYGVQQLKNVAGKVYDFNGDPVSHAQIEITNNAGAALQLTYTDQSGNFETEYNFLTVSDEVRNFNVNLTIMKKGFRVAHRRSQISATKVVGIGITLRPAQVENAALLSETDMIQFVAPRLREVGPADGLGAKGEKLYTRGAQEFLDRHHLQQAVGHLAEVAHDNPQCLRCRTMLGLAELDWSDWDDAERDIGETVDAYIADKKRGSFEPLFVEGEIELEKGERDRAVIYLAEAVKLAPQDSMALSELGRAQGMDSDWFAASESLKKAVAAGAGPEAQLLLAEALTWVGTADQAEAAFDAYLGDRDLRKMPPHVKSVWATIQAKRKDDTALVAANTKAKKRGVDPVDYLNHAPVAKLTDFEPAADQSALAPLLDAVGKNVAQLFSDLPNICSLESVRQERLTHSGDTVSKQENSYRYLMTAEQQPGGPLLEEHRANAHGSETNQLGASETYMLTSGFLAAPLVFHPAYQAGSNFRFLGTQKWNGRRTFIIAYAQEPGKTRIFGSFQLGNKETLTYSQGMAWVDAETYQIVHLVSDLLRPAPLMRLEKVTTEIEFGNVQFKKQAVSFWLPENVTVSLDWNGCQLKNKHAYTEFLVSNVDSSEKIAARKNTAKTPNGVEPANLHSEDVSLVSPKSTP